MNTWVLLINITSITFGFISILLNSLLIFVFLKCPIKLLSTFKYFFLFFAIVDILFSVVQAIFIPWCFGNMGNKQQRDSLMKSVFETSLVFLSGKNCTVRIDPQLKGKSFWVSINSILTAQWIKCDIFSYDVHNIFFIIMLVHMYTVIWATHCSTAENNGTRGMNLCVLLMNILSITFGTISIVFNLLLIFVFMKCPLKSIHTFKYFFILFAIVDIFFSFTQGTFVPITVSNGTSFVFLSAGLGGYGKFGFTGLVLFFVGSLLALLMNLNSFLYRYILLCRQNLLYIYTKRQYVVLVITFNFLIILDWTYSTFYTMPPTAEFTMNFRETVLNIVQIDIFNTAHFGSDQQDLISNPLVLFFFLHFIIIMVMIFAAIVYCIQQIHKTLKRAAISDNTRVLHSRMFNLLILQLLTPLFFLYVPCMISYLSTSVNIMNIDYVCTLVSTSYAIFPLVNPLIIIHYVKDYRMYLRCLFRLNKAEVNCVNTLTV